MPTRFLSDAEIARLESFPESIDDRDLARYFQLDGEDLGFVRRQHSAAGQLGIALQLCSLCWLGFIPDDLPSAPAEAIAALASVLDASPRAIFDYSVRPQTRREHRPLVREHAGFVAVSESALEPVRAWLIERAMEHERPSLLFAEVCGELMRRRIERPAVAAVMRLVAWARERAHALTFERVTPQLIDSTRRKLDGLLATEGGQSRHAWLRSRPTSVSAGALRRELDKRAFLIGELGADRFDLSALPPNRRAWLAQAGRQSTNQALARLAPERRYPVLVCFCVEALERATDDVLEVYDRARPDRPPAQQGRAAARAAPRRLLRQRRPRPPAHPRPASRTGPVPLDRRQRDHRLEHRLHPARPRRAAGRRRAHHHQRDRADLAARPPAHPPLRPLPVRPRHPARWPPAAASPPSSDDARREDAEPRLT
jgi:hypothetical protein